jgi:hypothetical protein
MEGWGGGESQGVSDLPLPPLVKIAERSDHNIDPNTNEDFPLQEDYIRPQIRDGDVVLEIECGSNVALLYLSR